AETEADNLRAQATRPECGKGNIVGDQLNQILIRLISAVKVQRPELKSFFVNLARAAVTKADARPADIDPMRAHGQKCHNLAAIKERRIDHDVIEMLAANIWMIHDQHVARLKAFRPVHPDGIDDVRAEIRIK